MTSFGWAVWCLALQWMYSYCISSIARHAYSTRRVNGICYAQQKLQLDTIERECKILFILLAVRRHRRCCCCCCCRHRMRYEWSGVFYVVFYKSPTPFRSTPRTWFYCCHHCSCYAHFACTNYYITWWRTQYTHTQNDSTATVKANAFRKRWLWFIIWFEVRERRIEKREGREEMHKTVPVAYYYWIV